MRVFVRLALLWALLCCVVCLLAACREAPLAQGVVAVVDGTPIHLRTLQALQDTSSAGLGAFEKASVSTLRKQYGKALSALIIQTLVLQELERLGMPVGDAAVSEAEMRIRQDYPDDEFEKHLRENAIDMDAWRELMRYRVGMLIFESQVLDPKLGVPLEAVDDYYTAHKADFVLPPRVTLYQVSGGDKDAVDKARAEGGIPDEGQPLRVYRLSLRRDAVPDDWKKAVQALKEGEATAVRKSEGGYEYVVLTENAPARQMTVVEAYPHIERLLLEEKKGDIFLTWLESRLQGVRISVSAHLLDEVAGKGE